jgi:hypothetical protein
MLKSQVEKCQVENFKLEILMLGPVEKSGPVEELGPVPELCSVEDFSVCIFFSN